MKTYYLFHYVLPILILLVCFCPSCNQGKAEVGKVGSSNKLLKKSVDSLLADAVQMEHIAGAVALIRKNGQLLVHESYGYRDKEEGVAQDTSDIFRLASMTKGVTAVAVLQLCQEGKLKLSDPVSKFLPFFGVMQVLDSVRPDSSFVSHQAQEVITVHHLLTHTSGIGYGFQDEHYNALVVKERISEGFCEDTRTSMENTMKIAALPLLHEPGANYTYGMSYDVLGTLVEVISGYRFDQYVKMNILEPLEMNDSYFIVPRGKRNRLVKVYQPNDNGQGIIPTLYTDINYPVSEARKFYSGGADLCGTAEDYSHFITMLMNNGRYKDRMVLEEKFVTRMLSRQSSLAEDYSYQGYGTWIINDRGQEKGTMKKGTYSFGGFFDTFSWADPAMDLQALLFLQMYPTNSAQIHEKYQELVYKKLEAENIVNP